jgi:hypothetical protein
LNPGCRGGKPATNRLSYGAALPTTLIAVRAKLYEQEINISANNLFLFIYSFLALNIFLLFGAISHNFPGAFFGLVKFSDEESFPFNLFSGDFIAGSECESGALLLGWVCSEQSSGLKKEWASTLRH